ncbi:uncharacterized protein [Apostichopus japonicus]|uniref:uncharacterized protein n=1 Tax=Stichopus japonicus TaxID=307972 RepID=UPI003AB2621F
MVFLKLLFLAIMLLLLLLAAPFVYTFGQVLLLRWIYRHIPSPKVKSFLLGHAKDLIEMEKQGKYYSMLMVDWKKIHGSVFVLFFVNRATVICLEPYIVKMPDDHWQEYYLGSQRVSLLDRLSPRHQIVWVQQQTICNELECRYVCDYNVPFGSPSDLKSTEE